MIKKTKVFFDFKKEEEWLAAQKGLKLVNARVFHYYFEESEQDYHYEYIYFNKSKKELEGIMAQIQDESIEFVKHTSEWALFRKEASKGEISVYHDPYCKYKMLMKKYEAYVALGACYITLGSSQFALSSLSHFLLSISGSLFYIASAMFFITSHYLKSYALKIDDGTYKERLKSEKKKISK